MPKHQKNTRDVAMVSKRKSKKELYWEPILRHQHGHQYQRAYKRLCRKMSTLKQSLKKRTNQTIQLKTIEMMFSQYYNKPCRYCGKILNLRNMVCDHIDPVSRGGRSNRRNLQLICKRCNTRKGYLNNVEYEQLLMILQPYPTLQQYVLKKLSRGGIGDARPKDK